MLGKNIKMHLFCFLLDSCATARSSGVDLTPFIRQGADGMRSGYLSTDLSACSSVVVVVHARQHAMWTYHAIQACKA